MPAETRHDLSTFEAEYARLDEIVSRLEAGNIPLAEMMKLYEEGTELSAKLSSMLVAAELKVKVLSKAHEELATFEIEPFESVR